MNRALSKKELEAIQTTVVRGRSFGLDSWQQTVAQQLGPESTFRNRGRPRKIEGAQIPNEIGLTPFFVLRGRDDHLTTVYTKEYARRGSWIPCMVTDFTEKKSTANSATLQFDTADCI